jgi:hypothetical protein
MVNIIIALLLTIVLYFAAWILFEDEKLGLITAAVFMLSGQTLYLMKLATYDMVAAFLLGLGFLMIAASTKVAGGYRNFAIFTGALGFFMAAIAKYLLPVFLPAVGLFVLWKHGFWRTLILFVLPIAGMASYYYFYGAYPPNWATLSEISNAGAYTKTPFLTLADWTLRWVAMAYLLAAFGIFHRKHGRTAIVLILLSTPVILAHLISGSEQSVNKNMIYTLVFLVPASALGVDHMARLFSVKSKAPALRTFYTAAVLLIFCVYGQKNLRWLEKQYPDMRPVIGFFEENGFDGMTVAMNIWGNSIYTYTLGDQYPDARFMHIEELLITDDEGRSSPREADFIVCEDMFYGKHCPCDTLQGFLDKDYMLLEDFTITLSWGETDARIYGRK